MNIGPWFVCLFVRLVVFGSEKGAIWVPHQSPKTKKTSPALPTTTWAARAVAVLVVLVLLPPRDRAKPKAAVVDAKESCYTPICVDMP